MAPQKRPADLRTPGSTGGFDLDARVAGRVTLERRLARVERELRIQFTRIAQLQAELDVALAPHRRATTVRRTGPPASGLLRLMIAQGPRAGGRTQPTSSSGPIAK